MGLNCQSVLLSFFIAIGSQVGKKLQPTKKPQNHLNKKTEKQHHHLKLQGKGSKFNSDKLFA